MQKNIKNNFNKILSIFILMQPVLDLITGICIHKLNINFTLGIIIRIIFLIFVMLTSTFIYNKKKNIIYYLLFIIYAIIYLLGIILFKDSSIFKEMQGLLRVFYFPLLLISLYSINDEIHISKMLLLTDLILYLLFIFIPNSLNLGFKSYEITKKGTLGFFNSANEISGIISILTPIMILVFKEHKNLIFTLLISILYLFVILTIGTKTPLLSLIITIFFALLWLWIKNIKKKNYKLIIGSFGILFILIITTIAIIPKTNFYKNIETHLNYLKVDDIKEVFEKPKLVDHFIFSQRLTFLSKIQKEYSKANPYQLLFGIGYMKKDKVRKTVEMDYFDIFYSHGIIGFILFFSLYLNILYKVLSKRKKFDFSQYMTYISIFLIIVLSLFTGHIITAPSVSLLVAIIILMIENKKKTLLFASFDLNVGGIEKALVNLVKLIDKNKYKVTIILEKKEGIFLEKIPDDVKVLEYKVNNNKNKLIRKIINYSKRLIFTIFNYNNYDFSCCYATYSYSCNKLAKISSTNSSIYIHSNYKYVYKDENKLKEFFDTRKLYEFKHIIFVSNESKKDYLKYYKNLEDKTIVFNNFVDIDEIIFLSKEKIKQKKELNKKLLVFVGRLDDKSKKLTRAINIVKEINNINLWIVGDGPDKKMYEEFVIKNKLQNKVTFIGRKNNPYPYMSKADFIILTSDYEGFPVTYLESIVLNKNLITTIKVSDDKIIIGKDYGNIISKENNQMIKEVKQILETKTNTNKINLKQIQEERMKQLEKLFNGVI